MTFPNFLCPKRCEKNFWGRPTRSARKWKSYAWKRGGGRIRPPTNYTVCSVWWCVRHVYNVKFNFQQLLFLWVFSKMTFWTCFCRFSNIFVKFQKFEFWKFLKKNFFGLKLGDQKLILEKMIITKIFSFYL